MKRILVYLSPERQCSLFDLIVAYDAGADEVISYGSVRPEDVRDIVYGCCFTRHPRDLANTCIFIGGHSVETAERLAAGALAVLDGLPKELRVSIALDPNGAYTTASACVAKIGCSIKLEGARVVVLAGTGPVGSSVARLLAVEGARVAVGSRKIERARKVVSGLDSKLASAVLAGRPEEAEDAIKGADAVVSAGPPGIRLLSESAWRSVGSIKALADANAVPPYGIEGVGPRDDGASCGDAARYGALAVGGLKMKLHQRMILQMFEERGGFFNLERVYGLCRSSLAR
ncbi:MAG: methylene-tetrahydromethanopterin dehydrogenase N-terminal domain-containing protein [Candidatus Altiarchaeota archaeon]|nr:methylene-tetrahydromethanopterin dehydrogenase N-terminal domain-containing protein [Candidatus Altiarchaeota archaeon]